jgi:hypothetical protein
MIFHVVLFEALVLAMTMAAVIAKVIMAMIMTGAAATVAADDNDGDGKPKLSNFFCATQAGCLSRVKLQ